MKIIFDSEKERNEYLETHCPSDVTANVEDDYCYTDQFVCHAPCEECWARCSVGLEVKTE